MQVTSDEFAQDDEIVIAYENFRLTAAPYGASLRGFEALAPDGEWHPLATGYHGAANKIGGEGDVLIPFPGRIAGGAYQFEGITHQLELTDKEAPNAIHGFLREKQWDSAVDIDSVVFTTEIAEEDYPGYPFSIEVAVRYSLDESGLVTEFAITNTSNKIAPVAAGFHPYFTLGMDKIDDYWLHIPMSSYLEYNQHLTPTGRIIPLSGTPYDFRQCHPIGDVKFNTCFLGAQRGSDRKQRIVLTDSTNRHSVSVWMDESFEYVVIYSGDPMPEPYRRRALAIEPMTCASDGFNHPEWGLVSLPPGETFSGSWGVETRWE